MGDVETKPARSDTYLSADFSESQRTFQKVSGLFKKSADFSESQRTFQKVSRLFRKSADFSESQRTFQKVSGLFRKSADFSESQRTFKKSAELFKSAPNRFGESTQLRLRASLEVSRYRPLAKSPDSRQFRRIPRKLGIDEDFFR